MKHILKKALLILLPVLALRAMTGCQRKFTRLQTPDPAATPFPAKSGLRIAVASDLHLNPDDTTRGKEATAAQYSMELVDALLWDAKQQEAEMILLTGDLVNGGRYTRHAALAAKLKQAEDSGLDVYVLPGNHDLAPVTQTEFAAFYADFGYGEAFSRDTASLSYCIIRDGLMLLMMDTAGYSLGAIDLTDPPGHEEAFLSEETLLWAEDMLKKAEEDDLRVLCAGHYNLLPEISRRHNSGYYVENGAYFATLLQRRGVPLYLSGHMHLRAVYREDGLTELLTEYLLSYPTGYSMLDLTDDGIQYRPRRIDVEAWAVQAGESDPVLLRFSAWQQEELRAYSKSNVAYMAERNPLSRREKKEAAEFFYAVMNAYWAGNLKEERGDLESMPGYGPFFRCADGYAYGTWLKDLIETAGPELGGFTLPWCS